MCVWICYEVGVEYVWMFEVSVEVECFYDFWFVFEEGSIFVDELWCVCVLVCYI